MCAEFILSTSLDSPHALRSVLRSPPGQTSGSAFLCEIGETVQSTANMEWVIQRFIQGGILRMSWWKVSLPWCKEAALGQGLVLPDSTVTVRRPGALVGLSWHGTGSTPYLDPLMTNCGSFLG